MGEMADMEIERIIDGWFDDDIGYMVRPPQLPKYHWGMKSGAIISMMQMDEQHIVNAYYLCIRKGRSRTKEKEFEEILTKRGIKYDANYRSSPAVTRSNIIDLDLHLFWETEKAIKVGLTEDEDEHVWLPKAWIEWTQTGPDSCEIQIPENKALEKGLI